jgi:NAD-dependent SIR2 family protein deacetylase
MSQTVFILGAGASRHAGVPVMREFMDAARDLLRHEDLEEVEKDDFRLVLSAIDALQAAHSKAELDIQNIEHVFAAFEMARLIGKLGSLSNDDIGKLPAAMRTLIAATIERSVKLQWVNAAARPSPAYEDFARLAAQLGKSQPVTVITFNYDLCFEHALGALGVQFDYGLGTRSIRSGVRLLKLHGSLNWVVCPDAGCGAITDYSLNTYFSRRSWLGEPKFMRLLVSSEAKKTTKCRTCGQVGGELMIIPPTWNKAVHQDRLSVVWRSAAQELQDAERIVVSGYSLPESDRFFHYLYALGTIGPANLRDFWVCDPDATVAARFKEILGPQARARFAFHNEYFQQTVTRARSLVSQNT